MSNIYKTALRNTYKQVRSHLSLNFQTTASRQICEKIKHTRFYQKATSIGFYHGVKGEISLQDLWTDACIQQKNCYFPVLTPKKNLLFLPQNLQTQTHLNKFGIPEPNIALNHAIAINSLELIFLPLLAFDRFGNRLGTGGGYYDFTLKNHKGPLLIGVAYAFQEEPQLLHEAWDIRLHGIVTENGYVDFSQA